MIHRVLKFKKPVLKDFRSRVVVYSIEKRECEQRHGERKKMSTMTATKPTLLWAKKYKEFRGPGEQNKTWDYPGR